jgi:hypothetical protein
VRAATLLVLAASVLGCGSEAAVSWGPLAVMRTDGGMAARNEGTLVVNDDCVFLERGGERLLLIWPADETSWSPANAEIRFQRSIGDIRTMRDGQRVVLGGGEFKTTVDGPNGEKLPRRIDWIAAPDLACSADASWLVSDVLPE